MPRLKGAPYKTRSIPEKENEVSSASGPGLPGGGISSGLQTSARLGDFSTDRRVLLLCLMALVVGTGGAFAALILLKMIALAVNIFWYGSFSFESRTILDAVTQPWGMVVPLIGALILGLMARFGSEKIRGHGIPEAIEAILYGESRMSWRLALLKPISSAISLGSGGPFGAEGPIIMTGGAVGSLFAQCFSLSAAERKTLLVAGAAAGMTGIFGTPIAAVLLAVEVLLFEWKPRSFIPVVVSALTAIAWRPFLIDGNMLFPLDLHVAVTPLGLIGAVGVGLLAGLQAAGLSTLLYKVEDLFHKLPFHWMWWPLVGAVAVGIGGAIEPRALGTGYESIHAVLHGELPPAGLFSLLLVKSAIWIIALASGTSGGVLAPLVMLGATLGGIEGLVLPGETGLWALIGIAGVLGGAMRAPLMGALFAVEVTGTWGALPLALAASGSAYGLTILAIRRSILTEKIARRGRHIVAELGVDPLAMVRVSQIMTKDVKTLPDSMTLEEASAFFEKDAAHRAYPVVDTDGRPVGMVSRTDVLQWTVTSHEPGATLGGRLSDASLPLVTPDDYLGRVVEMMISVDVGRIPVVDPQSRKLVGLVARRDLLQARVVQQKLEKQRQRGTGGVR